jgi:hypothetical protein
MPIEGLKFTKGGYCPRTSGTIVHLISSTTWLQNFENRIGYESAGTCVTNGDVKGLEEWIPDPGG